MPIILFSVCCNLDCHSWITDRKHVPIFTPGASEAKWSCHDRIPHDHPTSLSSIMASVIPASPSPQLQTVLKCLEGFNKWDLDLVTAEFSEDWKHYLLPRSLQSPGRNKEEWRIFFSPIHASLKDFTVCSFLSLVLDLVLTRSASIGYHQWDNRKSRKGFPSCQSSLKLVPMIPCAWFIYQLTRHHLLPSQPPVYHMPTNTLWFSILSRTRVAHLRSLWWRSL